MTNHFDMAKELARLVDIGKAGDELVAEMCRKFPTATAADCDRAPRIGLDRVEILNEERLAAARAFAEKWCTGPKAEKFFGSKPTQEVVDTVIKLHLMDMKLKPSADTLFPKPDKTKS